MNSKTICRGLGTSVLVLLIHINHGDSKLIKSSEDHISNLDYVRPEYNPFQSFKLKNGADVLVPGKKGERKGSLHDVDIVAPPLLKKTKKAKDTLLKAAAVPHVGYLDTNFIHTNQSPTRRDSMTKGGSNLKAKRPETEAERAERINKQFEKMMQFTALLGHVDSFLYDRTKSVVKTLHRMMGDSRELVDSADFNNNELRRRRQSADFDQTRPLAEIRMLPIETRTQSNQFEADYYDPRYLQRDVSAPGE